MSKKGQSSVVFKLGPVLFSHGQRALKILGLKTPVPRLASGSRSVPVGDVTTGNPCASSNFRQAFQTRAL